MSASKTNQSGQVAVFVALAAPFLIALLVMVINFSHLVDARIQLQVAVDRAAYAGAASLARDMNKIADRNWQINKTYRDYVQGASEVSRGNERTAQERFETAQSRIMGLANEIEDMNQNAYPKAYTIAKDVLRANLPAPRFSSVGLTPLYAVIEDNISEQGWSYLEMSPSLSTFVCVLGDENNCMKMLTPAWINGANPFDPESYNTWAPPDLLIQYFLKDTSVMEEDTAAFVARATAKVSTPLTMRGLFDAFQDMSAAAAAQPFGSSIEAMGRNSNDTLDGARSQIREYGVAFVPLAGFATSVAGDVYLH